MSKQHPTEQEPEGTLPATPLPPAEAITSSARPSEADAPAVWQVGDVILDLYEVTDILGEGGMGTVYKVHHQGWNVDLAVKSPKPETFAKEGSKQNFVREAETWVNLGLHPHTVSCYYVRTLGGIPRVFAEYVEGGSLADWSRTRKLYEGGPQKALERILDIAIQFAWGLHYAHEQGLVHQDVKPANVMMTPDGIVKVTDFGLAKAQAAAGEAGALPPGHSLLASFGGRTPAYCSPEQAQAAAQAEAGVPTEHRPKLTRKTDIWSWGVSVLEMFSGEPPCPYGGQAAAEVLEVYLETGAGDDDLPGMPTELAELLMQCFQQDPTDRPSNMLEVAAALQQIYEQEIGQPYPREVPQAVDLRADSLNNRALSLLDLGREEEAEATWQEALQADPQHLESTFNYGYWRWLKGAISGDVYVTQMQDLENSRGSDPDYWRCLGWIHLERGDLEAVEGIQQSAYRIEDEEFKKALEGKDRPVGRLLRSLEGHTGVVMPLDSGTSSVCFSPDGRYALTAGAFDKTIMLWEVADGRKVRRLEGHTSLVSSVCFSPGGRYALSGGGLLDETVRLWEVYYPEKDWGMIPPYPLLCRVRAVARLGMERDEVSGLLKSARDCVEKSSFPKAYRLLREVQSVPGYERDREVMDLLTFCGAEGKGRRTGLRGAWFFRTLEGHSDRVESVCFSPDGRYALSGSRDETIRLWEVASGKQLGRFEGHTGWVNSVCFSPDGLYALSGSSDFTVRLWEVESGRELRRFEGHTGWVVESVCFSPDGRYALSGSQDGTIRLWEVSGGREISRFQGQTAWVFSVCFSPDGRYGLFGSYDKTIRLWELATGGEFRRFEGHTDKVNSVRFSPDGRYALSGGDDKTARLWEVSSGRELKQFQGHSRSVESVCFSPDGRYALSGSWDETVRLWEVASERELRRFEGHINAVTSVRFSPDGRYALSGSWDETVRLWELDWEWEFPEETDWDEGARSYLEIFLTLHTPPPQRKGLFRQIVVSSPAWTEDDFRQLLTELGYRGYGWLRPEGVRWKLEEMAKERR